VLAPAEAMAEKSNSSLELAFRVSLDALLTLPKDTRLVLNVGVQSMTSDEASLTLEAARRGSRSLLGMLPTTYTAATMIYRCDEKNFAP